MTPILQVEIAFASMADFLALDFGTVTADLLRTLHDRPSAINAQPWNASAGSRPKEALA